MAKVESEYMLRALELAEKGLGRVSPNPMVGCVIVKDEVIIGEGWHQHYGEPHAEINAIKSVIEKEKIKGSSVFVTLEPCSHYGKTPPCADFLTSYNVGHVIIANLDVNPKVKGNGKKILEEAGIKVTTGILNEEARELNKRFFTYLKKKRPYIILKWAQTADGYIARSNHDARWISNEYSRQLVHKWRSEEDSIMVGAGTVKYDNPRLNVRDWDGKDPVRIVLDPELQTEPDAYIFDNSQKTIIYNESKNEVNGLTHFVKVGGEKILKELFDDLYEKSIMSVLIEGGAGVLRSVVKAGLWDEARVFHSPKTFGDGLKAPQLFNSQLVQKIRIFDDDLYVFKRNLNDGTSKSA